MDKTREEFFAEIVAQLGTTEIWTAAGFILPDGTLLDHSNVDIYPDPAVCVYNHKDLKSKFGIDSDEIMLKGGIRIGYGDTTDIPYAQIVLEQYNPTKAQWKKLKELLENEPGILDLEADMKLDQPMTGFYKRYYANEYTLTDMRDDVQAYANGDKTNIGSFSEKLGIPDLLDE